MLRVEARQLVPWITGTMPFDMDDQLGPSSFVRVDTWGHLVLPEWTTGTLLKMAWYQLSMVPVVLHSLRVCGCEAYGGEDSHTFLHRERKVGCK